jgi:hypothetical protein
MGSGRSGIKIGVALLIVIGMVIFYGIYNSVNTDAWDASVIALIAIVPIVLIASAVLDILGINIKF